MSEISKLDQNLIIKKISAQKSRKTRDFAKNQYKKFCKNNLNT